MTDTRLTSAQIAACIDHTLLKPDARDSQIEQLCAEAKEHRFFSVCVNGCWVTRARALLAGSGVKTACVAGFPLGAMQTEAKRFETEQAIADGADEIDVVINVGRLKDGDDDYVRRDLRAVVQAVAGRTVKVILETCLLTDDEKIRACRLVVESGAQFVKTSTGFSGPGATVADIQLMRRCVGATFGVKASGGVRDLAAATAMIQAGANRLGTSSGVAIIKGLSAATGY
jgi:deoxyribose-phosphate aldolase